jgi:hypothetical protein
MKIRAGYSTIRRSKPVRSSDGGWPTVLVIIFEPFSETQPQKVTVLVSELAKQPGLM